MSSIAEALVTAEEFARMGESAQATELVRGRVISVNLPTPRHGLICGQALYLVRRYLETSDIGRVVSNDSGVVTERDPDTVRGGDVAFYSYTRVPRGRFPSGYLSVVPEVVWEVRSASDSWGKILTKVGEYLEAGVILVCVLDDQTETAHVYRNGQQAQVFANDHELTLPEVLPGFKVLVKQFFEL
jgi:Uma2 family endonuclease